MKIATIGEIHEEGIKLIPKNKYEVIKISDYLRTIPRKM